jgi:hypothetical protein
MILVMKILDFIIFFIEVLNFLLIKKVIFNEKKLFCRSAVRNITLYRPFFRLRSLSKQLGSRLKPSTTISFHIKIWAF